MYQGHPTTFVVQEFGAPSSRPSASPVHDVVAPTNPTEPAIATTAATGTAVLGESTSDAAELSAPKPAGIPAKKPATKAPIAAAVATGSPLVLGTTVDTQTAAPADAQPAPVVAAVQAKPAPQYAPLWAHMFGSPRNLLQYVYYMLALLLAAAFAVATGLELRWHHREKAMIAGTLFVLLCGLFAVADSIVYTPPTLPATAVMTASAAASF